MENFPSRSVTTPRVFSELLASLSCDCDTATEAPISGSESSDETTTPVTTLSAASMLGAARRVTIRMVRLVIKCFAIQNLIDYSYYILCVYS